MEVFEWLFVTNVVEMADVSVGDKCAVFDTKRVGIFLGDFPACKSFPVHQRFEACFIFGR